MSNDNGMRESVRIYVTGYCDGLSSLREALASHPELDVVGWSDNVQEARAPLACGHLQVVLHGTGDAHLPVHELATIREHTQAPVIMLASGDSTQLLDQALDTDVADGLRPPPLTGNGGFPVPQGGHAQSDRACIDPSHSRSRRRTPRR